MKFANARGAKPIVMSGLLGLLLAIALFAVFANAPVRIGHYFCTANASIYAENCFVNSKKTSP